MRLPTFYELFLSRTGVAYQRSGTAMRLRQLLVFQPPVQAREGRHPIRIQRFLLKNNSYTKRIFILHILAGIAEKEKTNWEKIEN